VGIRRKGMTDTHNGIIFYTQMQAWEGDPRSLGTPLVVPFKVAPTEWSPAVAERSTTTHGYRRSFPQTVGRWHSDRSGFVSFGRVLPSGCFCTPFSVSRRSSYTSYLCKCVTSADVPHLTSHQDLCSTYVLVS
jgi:hypothetical protein